jgi:hypothetical protein
MANCLSEIHNQTPYPSVHRQSQPPLASSTIPPLSQNTIHFLFIRLGLWIANAGGGPEWRHLPLMNTNTTAQGESAIVVFPTSYLKFQF